MHILAGVPSTLTLLQIAGVELIPDPEDKSARPRLVPRKTEEVGSAAAVTAAESLPTKGGLDAVAAEARACGEINYVGTVLALAAFVSHSFCQVLTASFPPWLRLPSRQLFTTCRRYPLLSLHHPAASTLRPRRPHSWPSSLPVSSARAQVCASSVSKSTIYLADTSSPPGND